MPEGTRQECWLRVLGLVHGRLGEPSLRRHMRKCFWLRWKTPRGRLAALKRLGVKGRSLGMAYSGLGAWAIARHWVTHQALKNSTLNRYGFILPWDFAQA